MSETRTPTFRPPVVLTPEAFHEAIGGVIGKNRIYELLHAGRLRHVRNGSRFLILYAEVHDFFEREAMHASAEIRA
jgi:excisionase family DNA binding protein